MNEGSKEGTLSTFTGWSDIPEKLHPVCKKCIECNREKYNGFVSEGKTYHTDGFAVRCSYIPHDEVFIPQLKGILPDDDFEELNAIRNPLLWAERTLIDPDSGELWKAWPFQRGPLLCSSLRRAMRFGRRTGKSTVLAVLILWFILTSGGGSMRNPKTGKLRQNLRVLLLCPQSFHIANIFDRIRAFINATPGLSECIERNVRGSPQIISVLSPSGAESTISGFACGAGSSKSNQKGLSARGQDADLVVLDEGAYILEEVIKGVVSSILYTRPGVFYLLSSTPSGIAEDYFEDVCMKRPDFTEFYVPATERPDWHLVAEQMKEDFGSSAEEWDREILALFSQAGIGVFREDFIRGAQESYHYGDLRPDPEFIYTIGADWNKEHGTEIAVVGTTILPPHYSYIVLTENIPKKEFSSLSGAQRILALNRIWNPKWVYTDAGGGDGAALLIQAGREAMGRTSPDARLMDIVVAYDFGAKVEVRKANGKKEKYPGKQFMIEHLVSKLEIGALKYPREDTLLTKQLQNYIILRRTISGQPIYGVKEKKVGDHRLDAVALALVAIRLKFPSFYNEGFSIIGPQIGFIPPSGNKSSFLDQKPLLALPRSVKDDLLPTRRKGDRGESGVTYVWGDTKLRHPSNSLFNDSMGKSRLSGLGSIRRSSGKR